MARLKSDEATGVGRAPEMLLSGITIPSLPPSPCHALHPLLLWRSRRRRVAERSSGRGGRTVSALETSTGMRCGGARQGPAVGTGNGASSRRDGGMAGWQGGCLVSASMASLPWVVVVTGGMAASRGCAQEHMDAEGLGVKVPTYLPCSSSAAHGGTKRRAWCGEAPHAGRDLLQVDLPSSNSHRYFATRTICLETVAAQPQPYKGPLLHGMRVLEPLTTDSSTNLLDAWYPLDRPAPRQSHEIICPILLQIQNANMRYILRSPYSCEVLGGSLAARIHREDLNPLLSPDPPQLPMSLKKLTSLF